VTVFDVTNKLSQFCDKILIFNKKVTMNGIKQIRESFGLTQQQLAIYLAISHSLLRMAETGRRILPTHALLKLNVLDVHLQTPLPAQAKTKLATHVQTHVLGWQKKLTAKNRELTFQIALHKKLLEKAKRKHQQALQAMSFVHAMHAKKQKQKMDAKDAAWLQLLQLNAKETLANAHPLQHMALQSKIAGMQKELSELQDGLDAFI
jgi:DNA-binding transcriptional regulator YiaG